MRIEAHGHSLAEVAGAYAIVAQVAVVPVPPIELIDMHERQIPPPLTFDEYASLVNQLGHLIEAAQRTGHPHAQAVVWATGRRLVEYVSSETEASEAAFPMQTAHCDA